MTTSQVFADYLGMTPESAPWAFGVACPKCGDTDYNEEPKMIGFGSELECCSCRWKYTGLNCGFALTTTSPLAPNPDHGWLYVMVVKSNGLTLFGPSPGDPGCVARIDGRLRNDGIHDNPIHAVARALVAADPDLRARLEACEDWKEYAG